MYRDANGRFTSNKVDAVDGADKSRDTKQTAEVNDGTWGYYSLLLNKPFERIADMRAAEEAYKADLAAKEAALAAKEAARDAKKADAQTVQEAYAALGAIRREAAKAIEEARVSSAKSITEIQKNFNEFVNEQRKNVAEAEKLYNEALRLFQEKYPEGYHLTLRDSDSATEIETTKLGTMPEDFAKYFRTIFNLF